MLTTLGLLWRHRELIAELTRRELFQGHRNHMLGGLWVFANPLLTLVIYFLVFRFVFPTRLPGGTGSAEAFLLAGLVQWIVTSEVLGKACGVIRQNAGLVKQINFPIEVLVAKTVFASLWVQIVMSVGLLVLVLAGDGISLTGFFSWIIAFLLQACFLIGLALAIAALAPFVPDMGELVGLFARMGLFVTPILYTTQQLGPSMQAVFWANPFSYFAWIHQAAVVGQAEGGLAAWVGAAVLAGGALWAGSRLFRTMSPAFNDVI